MEKIMNKPLCQDCLKVRFLYKQNAMQGRRGCKICTDTSTCTSHFFNNALCVPCAIDRKIKKEMLDKILGKE